MSSQSFEQAVAEALGKTPGLWYHHPDDFGREKPGRPADFIYGHSAGWGILEVKHCLGPSLSPDRWTRAQRRADLGVRMAGGRSLLLVRFAGRGDRLFDHPHQCLWPLRPDMGQPIELRQLRELL